MADWPKMMAAPPEHDRRMLAARRRAQWELGDASWANVILAAYLDPGPNMEDLEMESGDDA